MVERRTIVSMIAALVLAGAMVGTGVPKSARPPDESVNSSELAGTAPQKSTGTPSGTANSKQKRVAAAEEYTRKRLLLMDTDKNGKVSKQEFMSFMEAEFDRLDTKHDGELDVKELAKLRLRPYVGK
jgi:hypothetical protein